MACLAWFLLLRTRAGSRRDSWAAVGDPDRFAHRDQDLAVPAERLPAMGDQYVVHDQHVSRLPRIADGYLGVGVVQRRDLVAGDGHAVAEGGVEWQGASAVGIGE